MRVTDGITTLEVNRALVEELFSKWGYTLSDDEVTVADVSKLSPELSAWGIPWKVVS